MSWTNTNVSPLRQFALPHHDVKVALSVLHTLGSPLNMKCNPGVKLSQLVAVTHSGPTGPVNNSNLIRVIL